MSWTSPASRTKRYTMIGRHRRTGPLHCRSRSHLMTNYNNSLTVKRSRHTDCIPVVGTCTNCSCADVRRVACFKKLYDVTESDVTSYSNDTQEEAVTLHCRASLCSYLSDLYAAVCCCSKEMHQISHLYSIVHSHIRIMLYHKKFASCFMFCSFAVSFLHIYTHNHVISFHIHKATDLLMCEINEVLIISLYGFVIFLLTNQWISKPVFLQSFSAAETKIIFQNKCGYKLRIKIVVSNQRSFILICDELTERQKQEAFFAVEKFRKDKTGYLSVKVLHCVICSSRQ